MNVSQFNFNSTFAAAPRYAVSYQLPIPLIGPPSGTSESVHSTAPFQAETETVSDVIDQYLLSPEWDSLAQTAKRNWKLIIEPIRRRWGRPSPS